MMLQLTKWCKTIRKKPSKNPGRSYHVAGNFRGRKLSQIGGEYNFCWENFHRLVIYAAKGCHGPHGHNMIITCLTWSHHMIITWSSHDHHMIITWSHTFPACVIHKAVFIKIVKIHPISCITKDATIWLNFISYVLSWYDDVMTWGSFLKF